MEQRSITPNLSMLRINGWQVYLWRVGESTTVIDTGAPGSGAEIFSAAPSLEQIVLTHGHVDHCGSAAELHAVTGAPVLAGAHDAAVIRGEAVMAPPVFEDWERPIHKQVAAGLPTVAPPVPVHRELRDGDVLDLGGGAEILAIPGHTEGSIAIHLPRHRVLFTGDTVANVGSLMLGAFNQDRARTIESFRRLATVDVDIACFGHGDPVTADAGERLRAVAASLT